MVADYSFDFQWKKEFDPVPETEVKWYGVIINIRPQVRKKIAREEI